MPAPRTDLVSEATPLRAHLGTFLSLPCAPALVRLRLFPNAKELSESVAAWVALRDRVLRPLAGASAQPFGSGIDAARRCDAVVVVGDGSRPRTAALIAHMMRSSDVAVFSVDPALHADSFAQVAVVGAEAAGAGDSDDSVDAKSDALARIAVSGCGPATVLDARRWLGVRSLSLVRARCQAVRVRCRRAALVLMHAHVSVEDAAACVDASEGVAGLVTAPCCNFEPHQRRLFGRPPDAEFEDAELLSDKRLVRVWWQPPLTAKTPTPLRPLGELSWRAIEAERTRAQWAAVCGSFAAGGARAKFTAMLPSAAGAVPSEDALSGLRVVVAGVVRNRPRRQKRVTFVDLFDLDLSGCDAHALLPRPEGRDTAAPPAWADLVARHAHRDAVSGRDSCASQRLRVFDLAPAAAAEIPPAAERTDAKVGRVQLVVRRCDSDSFLHELGEGDVVCVSGVLSSNDGRGTRLFPDADGSWLLFGSDKVPGDGAVREFEARPE